MKFYSKENCYDALKEAEMFLTCLQDDNFESKKELDEDIEHVITQINIAINYIESL